MLKPYFRNIIILVTSIILQKSFIWLISISQYNITPDLPFIVIIYIALKNGKLDALFYGFFGGLLIDILSGTFIGLCALTYTITGFLAGYLRREEDKYLKKYYFPVLVFIFALTGNSLYFFIYFQSYSIVFLEVMAKYVIPDSTYTALISIIYSVFPRSKSNVLIYR